MIENAFSFIKKQLDQHLAQRFDLDESAVVINSLQTPEGTVPKINQNKMIATLINLEHEAVHEYSAVNRSLNNEGMVQTNPPQYFSIDLLFTANFDDYTEALKFLSATIRFFQANAAFNKNNSPDMPEGLSELIFQTENTNYEQTHNLWSAMGATYQPSVVYKVRDIIISGDEINGFQQTISGISPQES